MEIFTIGFTQKTAEAFFETLRSAGIEQLIDVRLNNASQLAGFTKRDDLPYFLQKLCQIEYRHELLLAPTQEIMDGIKKGKNSYDDFERQFLNLMAERKIEEQLDPKLFDRPTVLLCSEATPEHCHRRLVAEYLQAKWGRVKITHL
ncbi:MAG: DUF488 family protein [Mycobacterium leprae]